MKTPYLLTSSFALAALALPACKTPTEYYCQVDSDCAKWPGRPFCDVNGDYPASEGIGRTCIPDPSPDAGVEPDGGDGADAGEGNFCDTCALGCDESGTSCLMIEPSNGLAPYLEDAADLGDITLPAGTTINTDSGVVTSPDGPIAVTTASSAQAGGADLRVFSARSFTIGDVRVQGSLPVAFVASGNVELVGIIDVSADMNTPGPGALDCEGGGAGGEPDGGHYTPRLAGSEVSGRNVWCSAGSGGGGFGSPGASGGDYVGGVDYTPGQGGSVNGALSLVPLRGGCPGAGSAPATPGAGGGAVQIVSGGQLLVTSTGGLHAGGGGGRGASDGRSDGGDEPIWEAAGGGSGGGILLEAATVVFEDSARILAAGGGGGGSGGCDQGIRSGNDAPANGSTAAGGACPMEGWGQPAHGGAGAAVSAAQPGMDIDYHSGGGGGGGLGRIRINTPDGGFTGEDLVTIRGALTTGTVEVR